jgi:hypothetical protein
MRVILMETEAGRTDMTETAPEPLADVNADLTRQVVIDTRQMAWEPSPRTG